MNKNEAIRSILKELEYGSLSAAETELRLNRLIDRELSRPLEAPVNTTLIDLCSALILRLHGTEPMTKSADAMTAAVLKRLEQEGKKSSRRHWLRPIAAAAVLALIAAGSLGQIHFHWFTGHSSQSQHEYIIEGHEINTGKTAEAYPDEKTRNVLTITSSSIDYLLTYLKFDPHLPADIGGTWLPVKYNAEMDPEYVEAACAYAPEGNLSTSAQVRYSVRIYSDPTIIPEVESLGEGGFVRMADTQIYRYISPVSGHIAWSWRRGNALLTLDAPLIAGLPESAAEDLIRSQAEVVLDEPPYFAKAHSSTPAPLQRQPRMNRRRLRTFFRRTQETVCQSANTSLELENQFGFSFGNLDVLPEEWQFEEAVSLFNEERIKVTITYSGIADLDRKFRLNIDVTADPNALSSNIPLNDGTVEIMNGVEVFVSSLGKRCEFSWSGQQTVYRVTSLQPAEEIAPAVRALVAGTMLETTAIPATPEPTPDTSFEDACDDLADEDAPGDEEFFLITEEDVRRTMAEQADSGRSRPRVTLEQVKAALERLGGRSMHSEDLADISEHLGFSLDYLSLEAFGWKIGNGEVYPFNGMIMVSFMYERVNEPQTRMTLHMDFHSDISELYLSLEQNREGTWKNINGIRVYTYANCDRNSCYWTEGMNSCMISSEQSAAAVQQIVDLLTRTSPLAEAPDEMQVHHITSEDLRQGTEKRTAAGLPDGRRMTGDMIHNLIEQHSKSSDRIISSDYLADAAMQLGCSLDHLFLEGIGWEAINANADFQHDSIMFELIYQNLTDPYQYARLVIYSYADIAAAHASVEQDEEGTHRTVDGHDLYTYTNHGRSGCVWYDGSSIYLLTAEQPDYVTQMAEQLARQL